MGMRRTPLGATLAAALAAVQFLAGLGLGYAVWGARGPEVAHASVRHVRSPASAGLPARAGVAARPLPSGCVSDPAAKPLATSAARGHDAATPAAAPLLTYCSLEAPGVQAPGLRTSSLWGSIARAVHMSDALRACLDAIDGAAAPAGRSARDAALRRDPAALALALEAWRRRRSGGAHTLLAPCCLPRH